MPEYPSRQQFFAIKFCRLLTKSAAALEIGPEVCWLLTVIVAQEDAVKYRRPVNFWNDQLGTVCGFRSRKRLVTARSKAINAGWLHYEQGDKRKPGVYWVTVPNGLDIATAGACDESASKGQPMGLQNGTADADGVLKRNGKPAMGVQNGTPNGTANRLRGYDTELETHSKGAPSLPNPITYKKEKFKPPSLEDVCRYVSEFSASKSAKGKKWPLRTFDEEHFVDHYTQNGWKQSSGLPIKDWKAAVRNWGRRSFGDQSAGIQQPSYQPRARRESV